MGSATKGDVVPLKPTGRLLDGVQLEATDCVTMVNDEAEGGYILFEKQAVLAAAAPNPFNPSTTILLTLAERARVTLSIYDVEGRVVKTLIDGTVGEGSQERTWDGKDANGSPVGSDIYFCRLYAGDQALTTNILLLK